MTRSGNEAISDAEQRAQQTAGKNLTPVGDLPVSADTANLRDGADLHSGLLALLPLVGVWEGEGEGHDPIATPSIPKGSHVRLRDTPATRTGSTPAGATGSSSTSGRRARTDG